VHDASPPEPTEQEQPSPVVVQVTPLAPCVVPVPPAPLDVLEHPTTTMTRARVTRTIPLFAFMVMLLAECKPPAAAVFVIAGSRRQIQFACRNE
jgi:hypothetical protein